LCSFVSGSCLLLLAKQKRSANKINILIKNKRQAHTTAGRERTHSLFKSEKGSTVVKTMMDKCIAE
jgi:hypothetical protein